MIEAADTEWVKKAFFQLESKFIFPRKFSKIKINTVSIKTGHSILLLQNHFSWWDGFLGNYLTYKYLGKNFHVMVQEDQVKKHPYLKYRGAFSVKKESREMLQSLKYASKLLEDSKNLVQIFPQGRLQSMHVQNIELAKGVNWLIRETKADCQVIYNAVTVDYLEGFKPTVTFNLLDCGLTNEINLENLQGDISLFHQKALESCIRK